MKKKNAKKNSRNKNERFERMERSPFKRPFLGRPFERSSFDGFERNPSFLPNKNSIIMMSTRDKAAPFFNLGGHKYEFSEDLGWAYNDYGDKIGKLRKYVIGM